MKRVLLVFLLITMGFVSSQTFKYGITANLHKTSIVNIHDYSRTPWGGGLGGFAEFALVENDVFDSAWLYLMPQIEFSMQGENAAPPQGKQQFPMHYIGLPIYLKYFFHRGNMRSDIFLFAGPRFEFMVYNDRKGPEVYDMFVDQEKTLNEFSYGVSMGAGYRLSDKAEVFLRFDRGLSKIYPDYTHHSTTYNRLLGIGFNYYLNSSY